MSASFISDLRERPAATVALFRNLLLGPSSGGNGTYSALDLATHFRDLVRNQDNRVIEDIIGKQTWVTVLTSGLLEIYAEVVSAPNFFSRPLDIVSAILTAFAWYCEEVEDDPRAASPLLARTVPLWSSVWNRHDELQSLTSPVYKEKLIIPLIELHYRYTICHYTAKKVPPPSTSYMEYSGLLLYTLSDQDDNPQTVLFSLRCLGYTIIKSRMILDCKDAIVVVKEQAHQQSLSHIGIEKLVLRFKKTLASPRPLDTSALYMCLIALWALACHPHVQSLLLKHGVFEVMCRALGLHDSVYPGAGERLRSWAVALDILGLLSSGRLKLGTTECTEYAEGVRGQDIADHFARGVKLATEMNGNMVYDFNQDPSQRLWDSIHDHNNLISGLTRAERAGKVYASPIRLVESMKTRAREVWLPSLSALEVVESRRAGKTPAKSGHGSIIEVWREYGMLLGLRENGAQSRQPERGARGYCGWNGCTFFAQPASVALRACSGCGEVYYCSEKCRNDDWPEVHKKVCKRSDKQLHQ